MFRTFNKTLSIHTFQASIHTELFSTFTSQSPLYRILASLTREAAHSPQIEQSFLSVREEITQIFAGQSHPSSSSARVSMRSFRLVLPTTVASAPNSDSFCLFSSDLSLASRFRRASTSVVHRRRSLNALDDKRLKLSAPASSRALDTSLLSSDTSLLEEIEPIDDIRSFWEQKKCEVWEGEGEMRVGLVDVFATRLTFDGKLSKEAWRTVLEKLAEQDARAGWRMMKSIQAIVQRRVSRERSESEQFVLRCWFGRRTSEHYASDFLSSLISHSVVGETMRPKCSCGMQFVWTEEEFDELQQLFCEGSRSYAWLVCLV